jgi:rhodanese-related sulfurtransferase
MSVEISAPELAQRLKSPQAPALIDVREPDEFEYCHIAGAQLKPLGLISTWMRELDPQADFVVICHHGVRSRQATRYLRQMGFSRALNLRGGIEAWAAQVDPAMPRY